MQLTLCHYCQYKFPNRSILQLNLLHSVIYPTVWFIFYCIGALIIACINTIKFFVPVVIPWLNLYAQLEKCTSPRLNKFAIWINWCASLRSLFVKQNLRCHRKLCQCHVEARVPLLIQKFTICCPGPIPSILWLLNLSIICNNTGFWKYVLLSLLLPSPTLSICLSHQVSSILFSKNLLSRLFSRNLL